MAEREETSHLREKEDHEKITRARVKEGRARGHERVDGC